MLQPLYAAILTESMMITKEKKILTLFQERGTKKIWQHWSISKRTTEVHRFNLMKNTS
jgi:FixJ family two-component response regulator